MNDLPACLRCTRDLRDHELGRYLCGACEDQTAANLAAIPGLFAQLDQHLARGSSNGPAVSGSKTAPAPVNLTVLNLQTERGPVLGPLETWVRDWEFSGYAEVDEAGSVDDRIGHACRTLRFNLSRAAGRHPAADEFADEVASIHRTLVRTVTGEKPARHVNVTCPCGQALRITLDVRAVTCPGCGTGYGHSDVLRLPLADRRAAA
ncbi:hypothetical protein ABGT92_23695 [Streptomyces cinereoruber]|uniref:hypothetical protein n=1 Tax=Streptomyces cinereoruber TaxID=67260 RepID=UPI00345C8A8D